MPWWTSPAGISAGFLLPVFLLIAYSGSSDFPGMTIRGLRYLTADYIVMGIGVIVLMCVTGWMGAQITSPRRLRSLQPEFAWERATILVGLIGLAAYAIFFKPFLLNPMLFVQTLTGAYRPDRHSLELTTGITSFDNMTPAFFSLYAYRAIVLEQKFHPLVRALFWVLLGATALRVYGFSERLAMIEALVPIGLAWVTRLSQNRAKWGLLLNSGPFLALPAVIVYFGAAEYFRSWQSSTYHGKSSFWEFAVGRLASYYYTSLNNGAGVLSTTQWPSFEFENTLGWLHRAPLIGPIFSNWVQLRSGGELGEFLFKYGDEEFNNPSGIFSVIYDLGLPLGCVYFALLSLLAGRSFNAYRRGSLFGVVTYPILFLTFLEIFRHDYLGSSRGFTWCLGVGLVLLVGRRRRSRISTPVDAAGTMTGTAS
jgi:hypothetical protein